MGAAVGRLIGKQVTIMVVAVVEPTMAHQTCRDDERTRRVVADTAEAEAAAADEERAAETSEGAEVEAEVAEGEEVAAAEAGAKAGKRRRRDEPA